MERIDKIISNQTGISRKDVKELIKKKLVSINNKVITSPDYKINSEIDEIKIKEEPLTIEKNIYIVLNKPKGYVSATTDLKEKTVLDLIPNELKHRNLFPAGRLDKDTTGLMLITDDGKYAHEILSPKKHIAKIYIVKIDQKITEDMVIAFQKGIILENEICQPAILEKLEENTGKVTLVEGKYHQIKRMFHKFHANVIELKRIQMGNFKLPEELKEGEYKILTLEELKQIK